MGSSAKYAELAAPVTWWVGKCHPSVTEDMVKNILKEKPNTWDRRIS